MPSRHPRSRTDRIDYSCGVTRADRVVAHTIQDVAALAGVSVGTVSNVLNRPELVSQQTRQRVLDVIEQVGFIRNGSMNLYSRSERVNVKSAEVSTTLQA